MTVLMLLFVAAAAASLFLLARPWAGAVPAEPVGAPAVTAPPSR
jgi:hypothetical protein